MYYVDTYVLACISVHLYKCVYIYIYIEREREIHIHTYICIFVYLSICIYIYIYIYIYVCTYILSVHTYIDIDQIDYVQPFVKE